MTKYIQTIKDYNSILLNNPKKLIIVDFFATWCGPCKKIAPTIEKLVKMYTKTCIFIKIDIENITLEPIVTAYNVNAFPTFVFIKNSSIIGSMTGADSTKLEFTIKKYI